MSKRAPIPMHPGYEVDAEGVVWRTLSDGRVQRVPFSDRGFVTLRGDKMTRVVHPHRLQEEAGLVKPAPPVSRPKPKKAKAE